METKKGQIEFDLGIGTLSSNKEIFIHAGCYTARYKQKGEIQIREKNSQEDWAIFSFGPATSVVGYEDMGDWTYAVKNDTFYEVKVDISNDQGRVTGVQAQ